MYQEMILQTKKKNTTYGFLLFQTKLQKCTYLGVRKAPMYTSYWKRKENVLLMSDQILIYFLFCI